VNQKTEGSPLCPDYRLGLLHDEAAVRVTTYKCFGGSWKCPSSAASCMKDGDEYVSLGQLMSGPEREGDTLKLQPTLISEMENCMYKFLWLTAAACSLNTSQHDECRVTNPATVDQNNESPDFYINICEPLNPIPGVTCPPGAAVCMDPDNGPPVGSPQMLRLQGCLYLFEWATPIVCPDSTQTNGCQLKDSQLDFTFDLKSLSGEVQVSTNSVEGSSGTYHINVCGSVAEKACMQSAVCQVPRSGSAMPSSSFGITKAMTMDFKHEEQAVLMQYGGGDPCPPSSAKRQSSILFMCDHSAGHGNPQLLTETAGCSTTFQWRTNVVCPPKKMECKLASGDIRPNGDRYIYHIQLSGITNPSLPKCRGANICQVKLNATYRRKIGSSDKAKYYIKEFMLETDGCQYLFVWHTEAVCGLITVDRQISDGDDNSSVLSHQSKAFGITLSLLLVVNTDGGEEEMEWLMEELEAPLSSSSHRVTSNHSNGHIRTKPVNTDGLHSFSLDEQDDDSEDEVLSVPGEESDEDLVGLLEESDRVRKSSKPRSSGGNPSNSSRKREDDDSDEDLLRV
ncbi:hypothetical protein XENOCAPTIV_029228, partial [Xenoophorus captivus]